MPLRCYVPSVEPSDTSQDQEMQELAAAEKDDLDTKIADISEEVRAKGSSEVKV